MTAIKLLGLRISVYTRIARLALEEKDVDYQLEEVDIFADAGPPAEYLAHNPFGTVPSLMHGDFYLYETTAISRYIDETFPGTALQPSKSAQRARMNQVISILDCHTYRPMVWDVYVQRIVVAGGGGQADENLIATALPTLQNVLQQLALWRDEHEFLIGDALTLAAWIHSEDLANCVANDCRILSKTTGTAEGDHYFMLSTIESGAETRLRFRLKTEGVTSTLIASSGDLPENTWVHAAAVYDGANMRLYLDGALVGSTGKIGTLTPNGAVAVWIGGNPPNGTDRPWEGMLDEVRIYDRALSATEIQTLPPPNSQMIFSDGFESGDTSAW